MSERNLSEAIELLGIDRDHQGVFGIGHGGEVIFPTRDALLDFLAAAEDDDEPDEGKEA